jgi:hypothetical protein
MFRHQVIAEIQHMAQRIDNMSTKSVQIIVNGQSIEGLRQDVLGRYQLLEETLKKAQSFHFGEYRVVRDTLYPKTPSQSGPFCKEWSNFKLPYDICWFDFLMSKANGIAAIGILLVALDEEPQGFEGSPYDDRTGPADPNQIEPPEILAMYVFTKEMGNKGKWHVSPIDLLIVPAPRQNKETMIPFCSFNDLDTLDEETKNHLEYLLFSVGSTTCLVLNLLSCKNIATKVVKPPKRLNERRLKRHRLPLYDYRVLQIAPTKQISPRGETLPSQNLWENRVHLCRGHFKTYDKDSPLFGRLTGRFWWQPQVRGNARKGIIHKDYQVKIDTPTAKETMDGNASRREG